MLKFLSTGICISTIALSGCNTIHKPVSIDDGVGLAVDAKQRLVLVTEQGGYTQNERVVCAEPSPDAITSIAFALSASAGTPEVGGAIGAGFGEAAASIGLRTQTIQLLRDGYYRLCEAYMNGTISRQQYTFALVNIDRVMVPLMAIDAIAGTPRAPAVVISASNPGASSSANLSDDVAAGSDGTGAQPASLNTTASVSPSTANVDIETVTQTKGGLSKEESAVLMKALSMVEGHSHLSLCTIFLADPYFFEASLKPNNKWEAGVATQIKAMEPEKKIDENNAVLKNPYQVEIAEACMSRISKQSAEEEEALLLKLEGMHGLLVQAAKTMQEANNALTDPAGKQAEINRLQASQVQLARELANKALEKPHVVVD